MRDKKRKCVFLSAFTKQQHIFMHPFGSLNNFQAGPKMDRICTQPKIPIVSKDSKMAQSFSNIISTYLTNLAQILRDM